MSSILEFKKIHNKSIDEIIDYQIPEIQRKLMLDKVEIIYSFQIKFFREHGYYCLNHSISVGIEVDTNKEYLLDGQHRMTAYKRLRKEFPERSMKIDIDYYYCKGMNNIEITYKIINTCTPNPIAYLGIDESKIISKFENLLEKQFPDYFKSSKKPNRPNLSLKNIRNYIEENEIIKKGKFSSGEQIFNIALELNKFYSNTDSKNFDNWKIKDYHKVLEKINEYPNKLYFGLYSNFEWIDRIVDFTNYGIPFDKIKHISCVWRPKITSSLKKLIWKETNGDTLENGKCYCCGENITFINFECGHIIPVSLGGETTLKNCKAICCECNSDMKTMNLEEYKQLIEKQKY
jgi:hypothetical protein